VGEILRVANGSGFWGDRFSGPEEMVRGGPIDVLTGDYLAELTMAILHKSRLKNPRAGYVPTFLKQLERVLGECLDRGIKVVANAGGLNPRGLAEEIDALAKRLGVSPTVAWVDGDDLMGRLDGLGPLTHLDRGIPLADAGRETVTANAYLGGWGIREALARGADIVVTGRVTDAALVVGPAAWRFGWARDDWDKLAGAVAAGHIIECSAQATGGNYSFFEEVTSWRALGFPIAEMHADGSFIITKHPGTGGVVNVGTVTAQLLYEIEGPRYANPDVVARFDTLQLTQEGPDRVLCTGARGEPPPPTTKACLNLFGGYRNTMSILLGGLELEKKARIVEDTLFDALGGKAQYQHVDVTLQRMDRADPQTNEEALAYLKVTVMSPDKERVGRRFASAVVEQALSTVPGFSSRTPPEDASPYLVYWPALVDSTKVRQTVHVGGEVIEVPPVNVSGPVSAIASRNAAAAFPEASLPSVRAPLGRLFGTRSGDKGGNANLGVWAKSPAAFAWLRGFLTVERLQALCPDLTPFPIARHELPNLLAMNFYIRGFLGEGVASSSRTDPQAKTLGEYLRAKWVEVPASILK
jgi:hypothetical protein